MLGLKLNHVGKRGHRSIPINTLRPVQNGQHIADVSNSFSCMKIVHDPGGILQNQLTRLTTEMCLLFLVLDVSGTTSQSTCQTHTYRTWSRSSQISYPESKIYGANMGPTWVLSAPDGLHVGPMNLAIRVVTAEFLWFSRFQVFGGQTIIFRIADETPQALTELWVLRNEHFDFPVDLLFKLVLSLQMFDNTPWKRYPHHWPFVWGIHQPWMDSVQKWLVMRTFGSFFCCHR